jgi:soluble lytic murein transglycosylase
MVRLTIPIFSSFAKVLAIGVGIISVTFANPTEISRCGRALYQATQGNFDGVLRSESCPLTAKLVSWLQLQKPGASFAAIGAFIQKNPDWPLKDRLLLRAEESLSGEEKPGELIAWFSKNPPQTVRGARFYAHALLAADKKDAAVKLIRDTWVNKNFDIATLKSFFIDFKGYLTQKDHQQRVNRLLMEEEIGAAKHMLSWLSPAQQDLAQARIALITQAGDVAAKIARVSRKLLPHTGLIYDRIKWHRRKESNALMLKLFLRVSQPEEGKDLWWRERNLLVRRLMDDRQYENAYKLVKGHGLTSGENFANAEWLAGWIALRMLKKPMIALKHFETLHKGVKSPISVARAAYWMGRTYDAMKKKQEAHAWMERAKAHPGTYYGQIALRGSVLGTAPALHSPRPKIDGKLRHKFEAREFVRMVRLLQAVGAKDLVDAFGIHLSRNITDPAEQILLIEFARKEGGPYHGVVTAKKLTLKTVPLIEAAYPILSGAYYKILQGANPALVHAIIRQESRFKADALSPAGAQGLMQLMPKTAQQTAQKFKVPFGSLVNPKINISLGCAHLRELLRKYGGSLILSIAAYNAGSAAVESWIQQYGDPRRPGVDLVDWIETIPYAETRNYVQRVLENYAYYAQQLGR